MREKGARGARSGPGWREMVRERLLGIPCGRVINIYVQKWIFRLKWKINRDFEFWLNLHFNFDWVVPKNYLKSSDLK